MPRRITPRPATQDVPPTVEGQHIDGIIIEAGLDSSGNVDPAKVWLSFTIHEIDDVGTILESINRRYPLGNWPPAIRQMIIDLRAEIVAMSVGAGDIDAGTDDGEIAP
jgi:hypothetical protein